MRIVLCCGDRSWNNQKKIYHALKKEHERNPISYVIEGGQSKTVWEGVSWSSPFGADYQAKLVAQELGIQVIECPANWDKFKKAAGPIRNQKMLELMCLFANLPLLALGEEVETEVLAFHPDIKQSKGTKDMVSRAKKANIKVRIIK